MPVLPGPDPTERTVQALAREIEAVCGELGTRIDHNVEVTELKTKNLQDEMDRRLEALHKYLDTEFECQRRVDDRRFDNVEQVIADRLAEREMAVTSLTNLVETRFTALEARAAEQKQDTKIAVDAAFLAARDAVGAQAESSNKAIEKAENSTSKLIEGIGDQIRSNSESWDRQFRDLKERVDRSEGSTSGGESAAVAAARTRTFAFAVIGAVGTIVFVLIALGGILAATGK